MRPDRAHDLSPALERLMEKARTRRHARVLGPELRGEVVAVVGFLAVAVALAYAGVAERPLDVPLALCLVGAYALLASTDFRTGTGVVLPTEIMFVPMLLLLPTPLVPLLVLPRWCSRPRWRRSAAGSRRPGSRSAWPMPGSRSAPRRCSSCSAPRRPTGATPPVYVAALAAQFACDGVVTVLRARRDGARVGEVLVELRQAYRVRRAARAGRAARRVRRGRRAVRGAARRCRSSPCS